MSNMEYEQKSGHPVLAFVLALLGIIAAVLLVFLTGVIGGGTVQAGQGNNDLPMTFEAWSQIAELVSFYDSLGDGMNDPDWEEYAEMCQCEVQSSADD